jgi:hypothetical protein
VFDGASLALVAEHPRGRDIVVLALASGRILQTIALPPGTVRIAARRGLAVVHDAARRLAVVDLRFARHLGAVVTDGDVADVAIDPDGGLLAIRLASGELELAPIGERMRSFARQATVPGDAGDHHADPPAPDATQTRTPEPPPEATAEVAASIPPSEIPRISPSAPPSATPTPKAPLPTIFDALDPRPIRTRLPRAAALVELDRELRSVTLWALRAISSAWDTRRLGYGNEGHHPYEHEVAALVGMNAGFAPDYLEAARNALAEHEAALAADPQHRSSATPLAEPSTNETAAARSRNTKMRARRTHVI